ncbi:hypothetical protein BO94DRAFT_527598 [Aspergillus sclerotioniger CBS 115572]|uniref:Mid2 domain-containing protein n=1 Tax=Aspergillus sclerotioniger CBS 115572 TaxID=1450535 RepID=A0A317V443_9EURO|nr:hypothetical protein BO94DRAFT_527598 [Aspergillus sclerotioniger CBS 115572]PWY69043.1 hypothetical protein BO94DRAFT_527598 [Aspergillus sclerotioniger CBS 115572]
MAIMLLTILPLTLLISLTTARTCYHPDKSIATSNVPCTSDSTTFCCDSGAICMTNGYCIGVGSQPYLLFRGACTDQDWGDNCPSHCANKNPTGGAPIIGIGSDSSGNSKYCCGFQVKNNGSSECVDGDTAFTLDDGEMILGKAALENVTSSSSSSATSTSTGTMSTATVVETMCSASDNGSHCGTSNATAVGAGVGVPLGVLAVSAAIWALWERGRRRTAVAAAVAAGVSGSGGYVMEHQVGAGGMQQNGHGWFSGRMEKTPLAELGHGNRGEVQEMMGSGGYRHS